MRDFLDLTDDQLVAADLSPAYIEPVSRYLGPWAFKPFVDILVVVDEEISTQPITAADFGVGYVIELIRNTHVGCTYFRVDIALRSPLPSAVIASPAPYAPKYVGFRFDMTDGSRDVIDKYEQIWCFGFKPSNSGSPDDGEIELPEAFPASDAELAKLSAWMKNRKGGLFGTGDHHFLGASMCRRIPRLGTMRRWTNADGVPPVDTPDRIDTLRPPSPLYEPSNPGGPEPLNNTPHQGDLTVQPIQWTPWQWSTWPIFIRKRPHPVLCHPKLGPIDVMPDHAHEGLCVENPPLDGTYDFEGNRPEPEYPDAVDGGPKPAPVIIAYGSTLGHPPYNFGKLDQPARPKFPMISVYDGHRAGVGRVATDSTWHHWMNVNLEDIRNADTRDWKLIKRYFINLAVWLSPPSHHIHCLYVTAFKSHFHYPGFQEYRRGLPTAELGRQLKAYLSSIFGPCWVRDIIWWEFAKIAQIDFARLQESPPRYGMGVLDGDVVEDAILGRIVEQTWDDADAVKRAGAKGDVAPKSRDPEALFKDAFGTAIGELSAELREHSPDGDAVQLLAAASGPKAERDY